MFLFYNDYIQYILPNTVLLFLLPYTQKKVVECPPLLLKMDVLLISACRRTSQLEDSASCVPVCQFHSTWGKPYAISQLLGSAAVSFISCSLTENDRRTYVPEMYAG